jgi:hypothetical protein
MHGTRIEKEVEICATNLANRSKCVSTNAKKWKKKIFYMEVFDAVKQKAGSKVPHLQGIGWPQIAAMGWAISPILSCMTKGWNKSNN